MALFQRKSRNHNPIPPPASPHRNQPRRADEPIDPALPQLHTTKWVVGWKVANLLVSTDGRRVALEQVMQNGHIRPYKLDDTAMCNQHGHTAPAKDCGCGFNAYPDREAALDYGARAKAQATKSHIVARNLVLLRVGLYGRMIEGTFPRTNGWGYRSTKQRVDTIYLPSKCVGCDRKAGLAAAQPKQGYPHFGAFMDLAPSCTSCVASELPHFTLDQLAKLSKVKVKWL